MTRGEAHNAANAGLAFGHDKSFISQVHAPRRGIPFECGVVVLEDESGTVLRIPHSSGALISRTQIAGRIVFWLFGSGNYFSRALPGPLRAVRRYQHPFIGEW